MFVQKRIWTENVTWKNKCWNLKIKQIYFYMLTLYTSLWIPPPSTFLYSFLIREGTTLLLLYYLVANLKSFSVKNDFVFNQLSFHQKRKVIFSRYLVFFFSHFSIGLDWLTPLYTYIVSEFFLFFIFYFFC